VVRTSRRYLLLALPFFLAPSTRAQDLAWQPVATDLIAREKPGYGGLSGIAVDRATGHVFAALSDRGVFRSRDQCKTWERHGEPIKGRTETPGCLQLDPTGKSRRILMPVQYFSGSTGPSGLTPGQDGHHLHPAAAPAGGVAV
jgi:hypothetical protein